MVLGDTTFRNLIPDVSLEDCLPKRKSVWGHRGDFFSLVTGLPRGLQTGLNLVYKLKPASLPDN